MLRQGVIPTSTVRLTTTKLVVADKRACTSTEKVQHRCNEDYEQGRCVALLPPKYPSTMLKCECSNDFTGVNCELSKAESDYGPVYVASSFWGVAALLILIVAIVGIIYCCRKRAPSTQHQPISDTSSEPVV